MLEEERSRHNCRKLGMRLAGELLLSLAPAPPPACLRLTPACTFNAVFSCTSTTPCLHCFFLPPALLALKYIYERISSSLQPAPTNPKETGPDFACLSDPEKEHWRAFSSMKQKRNIGSDSIRAQT